MTEDQEHVSGTEQAGHEEAHHANVQEAADAKGAELAADVRRLQCDVAISKHVGASLGAGFIPLPVVDFVTITGVQINLLYRLCRIYDVEFSKESARSIITSLLGASVPGLQGELVGSGLKMIPIIGTVAGMVAAPVIAGASTYAVGKVFVLHLESGGTLLTFDAKKMKAHFEQALQEGKRVIRRKPKASAEPAEAEAAS